jgi:ABC-2 type transport system ATP-binding protein
MMTTAPTPGSPARAGFARDGVVDDRIVFENVSKFYGDVLGVNRVTLSLPPGITSLVGPNGSGKTTLMNLMTGLVQPTRGHITVLGMSPGDPYEFFRVVGYCTQFDSFPRDVTGFEFVYETLLLHGLDAPQAAKLAVESLERVGLMDAAKRLVAGYSKGMRQKARLAQAIAHHPSVLVLDEPLNGLDPMARAESLALFETLGRQGMHVVISSHILEEVDRISDQVVLMSSGYVVAEGNIHTVRQEVREHPMQILIRCTQPALLASQVFALDSAVEAKLHADGGGLLVRTRDLDNFYELLNRIAAEGKVEIQAVAPADDDANSIYQYLIGSDGGNS